MANPYTKPTISGYNANPPADDGSKVAANEITWSKHKSKLGDPVKNYADNINTNTESAFAKRLLNAVSAISSNYTVLTSDRGKLLSCTNTITITLPSATTSGSGFELVIRNDGLGVVTVDGDGSETVNGSATVDLQSEGWLILVSDGSNWVGPQDDKVNRFPNVNSDVTATDEELNKLDGNGTLGVLDFQVNGTSKTTATWNFNTSNNDLDITTT